MPVRINSSSCDRQIKVKNAPIIVPLDQFQANLYKPMELYSTWALNRSSIRGGPQLLSVQKEINDQIRVLRHFS
jgi:hypothetical protein